MLLERIEADRDTARREGRKDHAAFYSYLIAEARKPGKTANRDSTDEEIIGVVQKLLRQNDETLAVGNGQGDERLRQQNKLLTAYLPNQMDEAALRHTIQLIIDDSEQPKSKRLLGFVMKTLKEAHSGEYAPALASHIASELLEKTDEQT